MGALNQAERNSMIWHFIINYLIAIMLVSIIFYFQFVVIPRVYNKETALTNVKIEELVKYTNNADSLVLQIQKAKMLDAKSLVPFYNWTNNLKAVYKQPFYEGIISSYADLVNDITLANGKDTTLISLKIRMITLQQKNMELIQQGEELKLKLIQAKTGE